ASGRAAQVLAQALLAIAGDAEVEGLRGGPANEGIERVRVRAGDLGTGENRIALLELRDLIARSHERDAWPAIHQGRIVDDRCQHAELRRAECGAGGQDDSAFANILAAAPDVLLRVARVADRDSAIRGLRGVFLADHGVGAL